MLPIKSCLLGVVAMLMLNACAQPGANTGAEAANAAAVNVPPESTSREPFVGTWTGISVHGANLKLEVKADSPYVRFWHRDIQQDMATPQIRGAIMKVPFGSAQGYIQMELTGPNSMSWKYRDGSLPSSDGTMRRDPAAPAGNKT